MKIHTFICTLTIAYLCVCGHYAHGQSLRDHLPVGESYGIAFTQPDTVTSLSSFERNDKSQFLSPMELESRMSAYKDFNNAPYEKQRIEEGENIYVCFRIKECGMWTRHTYWLHFEEGARRPMIRQRVFIDKDTLDLIDKNDLLVFQANYGAFEVFKPVSTQTDIENLEGIILLEYLEELITFNFRSNAQAWSLTPYPEFGNITAHEAGIFGSSYPKYISSWFEQRIYNENHEFYLGYHRLEIDSSSLYFLFYPIGDVQSLYSNGNVWLKYYQFYCARGDFKNELSETVEFWHNRDYFVGLSGTHSYYYEDGTLAEESHHLAGMKHGPKILYSEAVSKTQIGSIKVLQYSFDYLSDEISVFEDLQGPTNSTWNSVAGTYKDKLKQIKKSYRRYKKHCRKWRIAKIVMTPR